MTQREVWEAAGLTRTVYNRLERGGYKDPPLRRLSKCAIVLGVPLEELIEPQWREWWKRQPGEPERPADPSALWRNP